MRATIALALVQAACWRRAAAGYFVDDVFDVTAGQAFEVVYVQPDVDHSLQVHYAVPDEEQWYHIEIARNITTSEFGDSASFTWDVPTSFPADPLGNTCWQFLMVYDEGPFFSSTPSDCFEMKGLRRDTKVDEDVEPTTTISYVATSGTVLPAPGVTPPANALEQQDSSTQDADDAETTQQPPSTDSPSSTPTGSSPASSASSSSSSSPSSSSLSTGAIVGIAVASGALVLCVLGGVFFVFLRKRKQQQQRRTSPGCDSSNMDKPELDGVERILNEIDGRPARGAAVAGGGAWGGHEQKVLGARSELSGSGGYVFGRGDGGGGGYAELGDGAAIEMDATSGRRY